MQKSGWTWCGVFVAVLALWAFPAFANCVSASSGYTNLVTTITYVIAIGFFIRAIFLVFRGVQKKEYSFRKVLPRMSVYLTLCVVFVFIRYPIGYYFCPHLAPPSTPCCSAERIEMSEGRHLIVTMSDRFCGCNVCKDSEMFKPPLQLDKLLDDGVLIEGKQYLLTHLFPEGTDVNLFKKDMNTLGLREVDNFCRAPDSAGYVGFWLYMNRGTSIGEYKKFPHVVFVKVGNNGRVQKVDLERPLYLLAFEAQEEALLELSENNLMDAQIMLSEKYARDRASADKSYFWYKVSELNWLAKGSAKFTKKYGGNLSPAKKRKIDKDVKAWWDKNGHVEFCVPANFNGTDAVNEYVSLMLRAEKGEQQAQYLLARLYQEGRPGVVRQSAEKAHKWLSAAAVQGYEDAKKALDEMNLPRDSQTP